MTDTPAIREATKRQDQLFRAMRASVKLVQELDGHLSEDSMLCLKAAAIGQMQAYAELTGLPTPMEIVTAP
jgi:hypothetical protein